MTEPKPKPRRSRKGKRATPAPKAEQLYPFLRPAEITKRAKALAKEARTDDSQPASTLMLCESLAMLAGALRVYKTKMLNETIAAEEAKHLPALSKQILELTRKLGLAEMAEEDLI